ncbi:hypothetical protein UFOVP1040_52 [uncultured Caudovirales phage]|uniref:Uncharacterized protein n=1 Tax=uncultured Caudovirales phage TaxID=2100421 RepID=A0A6J5QGW6_9CAUD|nr:hypothetical protein UFOVP1040_52 [uncultured Caudovirales phage]
MQLNRHQMLRKFYELSQAIEVCGASPELTAAVIKCGDLMREFDSMLDVSGTTPDVIVARSLMAEIGRQAVADPSNPPVYVVCDRPPGHESPRFVEVEDAKGRGLTFGWTPHERTLGYWRLGPFYARKA